jgi:hypothetical protein
MTIVFAKKSFTVSMRSILKGSSNMAESPFFASVKEHRLVRRYSRRTVESYLHWIKRYILFRGKTLLI